MSDQNQALAEEIDLFVSPLTQRMASAVEGKAVGEIYQDAIAGAAIKTQEQRLLSGGEQS